MSKYLVAAASLAALVGAADAADFFGGADPAPAYVPTPLAYDWAGLYVGAHGGYGWGEVDPSGAPDIDDVDGWLGGVQAGYNYLYGSALLGVEFDASLADLHGSSGGVSADIDWLASARLRAGYAVNQFLLYGTGGLAFGGVDISGGGMSGSETHFGWVAGLGGEYMITRNITVRGEFLHYGFGDESYSGTSVDANANVARIGANVKF